jgi:hypothetical protein
MSNKYLWLWLFILCAIFDCHDFMIVWGLMYFVAELKDIYHVSN